MKVPVFRAGKYANGAIKEMVPDGRVTVAHIAEMAANTTKQMTLTKWRPRVKLGHGTKPTIGWIEKPPEARGRVLYADLDLNKNGKALVGDKLVRFVSAEIDSGRSLFGDEDGERLGLRLGSVAVLDEEDPQIKDLCDLSQEAQFHEDEVVDGLRIKREFVREDADGRVAYFAEIEFTETQTSPQEEFMDEKEAKELQAKFAETERQLKEKEAELAQVKVREERATFAESVRSIKSTIAAAMKDGKLGASAAEKLSAFAVASIATPDQVAQFSEVLSAEAVTLPQGKTVTALFSDFVASLGRVIPGAATAAELRGTDAATGTHGITLATFSESATNIAAAKKIRDVIERRQQDNPKFTRADLMREVAAAAQ